MYDYDFQRDKDFFKKSPAFNEVLTSVKADKYLQKEDAKIIDTAVQLWAESVLKHNLSAHMARIDPFDLISDENSNDVKKMFGKILNKEKHKRTDADYQVMRKQSLVQNTIVMHVYAKSDNTDYYQSLKDEFKAFKEPAVTKKIKP